MSGILQQLAHHEALGKLTVPVLRKARQTLRKHYDLSTRKLTESQKQAAHATYNWVTALNHCPHCKARGAK